MSVSSPISPVSPEPKSLTSTVQPGLSWSEMADAVLDGQVLSREDALRVLHATDDELLAILDAAYRVRRAYFGRTVQLYYLKNAKSGLCPED
ncbi:MAG: biotin synthase BioB, partial [Planctomycetota bacterium]